MAGLPPRYGGSQRNLMNPAGPQGLVVLNGRVSEREINSRRSRHESDCAIGGPVDDGHLEVATAEPVLRKRAEGRYGLPRNSVIQNAVECFTSLNRIGSKNDTLYDLILQLSWVGLARNHTSEDESKRIDIQRGFAVIVGGIYTMINTGPDIIHPNDRLYWDIVPHLPEGLNGRPKDKVVATLRPLTSEMYNLSGKVVKELSYKKVNDMHEKREGIKNNNKFHSTIHEDVSLDIIVNLLNILTLMGPLMKTFVQASSVYTKNPNGVAHINIIEAAISAIKKDDGLTVEYSNALNSVNKMFTNDPRVLRIFLSLLYPEGDSDGHRYTLANMQPGNHDYKRETAHHDVASVQRESFKNLIYLAPKAMRFFTDREVGRAVTGASVGQNYDLILGSYSS